MAKSNVKTIRLSDELLEMIESQAGDNFTAKFEALVTRCMWELPRKEQKLAGIQEQIDIERKRLERIRKTGYEIEEKMLRMSQEMTTANARIKILNNEFKEMIDRT